MKLLLPRIIAFTAGLFCLIVGLYVFWQPVKLSLKLSYAFETLAGLSEFMVFYGGFSIGMSAFFLAGAIVKRYLEASLLFLALSSLAALLTRTAIIFGTVVQDLFYLFYAGEILLFILGSVGWIICRQHFIKIKKARKKMY
jgi:hypothetical protein